ncbi:DUF6011 domain-containing protein [Syntrophothermus sp.]|uniref:DUF6011 domain-containing protein n=1 Tax=Syntrophothermus sp. TaxID=2736299 RepID=UPI00338E951C
MRCNRVLSNPHSIARSLGPVCYKKAGGGVFDADLQADDNEWSRAAKYCDLHQLDIVEWSREIAQSWWGD